MREIGEKTEPARTYKVNTKLTCDLCGEASPDPNGTFRDTVSWCSDNFDVVETAVFIKEGCAYPEGGRFTFTEVDSCGGCFLTKLVPWLKEQGATMRGRSVDL